MNVKTVSHAETFERIIKSFSCLLLRIGSSILRDGHTSVEEYGQDLDQLGEGDRIGVIRTERGALHFYVNGEDQGPAVSNIPERVWAIVDMYGKCAQVTIVDDVNRETSMYFQIHLKPKNNYT